MEEFVSKLLLTDPFEKSAFSIFFFKSNSIKGKMDNLLIALAILLIKLQAFLFIYVFCQEICLKLLTFN